MQNQRSRALNPSSTTNNQPIPGNAVQLIVERLHRGDQLRFAACLINAGQFDQAAALLEPLARLERERLCADDSSIPAAGDAPAESSRPDLDDKVQAAIELRDAGDSAGAIKVLRSAVASDPERAEYHYELGTVLAALGEYDEAELRFTQAAAIMPGHADALVSLALCHGMSGRPADAVRYLERAQAMQPENARIAQLLAHAARKAVRAGVSVRLFITPPDMDTAIRHEVENLHAAGPHCIDEFLALAPCPVHDRILETLLQVLSEKPNGTPACAALHCDCGRILSRLGRQQQAIEAFEQAMKLDSGQTIALVELAKSLHAAGRATEAAARLEQALAAGAECPDVLLQLGHAYKQDGKIVKAASAYRRALALNRRYEAAQQALSELSA